MKSVYFAYWQGKDEFGRIVFDSNTSVEWLNPGVKELNDLNSALLDFAKSKNKAVVRIVITHLCKL